MSTATLETVYVIDDDPAARESVAALVRSHGVEAEIYGSAEEFLENFDRRNTGCLVIDVRMKGISGLELQERLKQEGIELPVIIITGYGNVPTAVQAMRSGALMFLEKPCNERQLWDSIYQALQSEAAMRALRAQRTDIRRNLGTLSPEEHAVLERLLAGKPNKIIAKELDLGLRTVELRRATILQKMQTKSLAELVQAVTVVGDYKPAVQGGETAGTGEQATDTKADRAN